MTSSFPFSSSQIFAGSSCRDWTTPHLRVASLSEIAPGNMQDIFAPGFPLMFGNPAHERGKPVARSGRIRSRRAVRPKGGYPWKENMKETAAGKERSRRASPGRCSIMETQRTIRTRRLQGSRWLLLKVVLLPLIIRNLPTLGGIHEDIVAKA